MSAKRMNWHKKRDFYTYVVNLHTFLSSKIRFQLMPDENEQLRDVLISQIDASPNSSFFIRMEEQESLLIGVQVFRNLVNFGKKRGVYLTCNANAPSNFLENYLGAHDIDTSRVIFVDTISKTFLARKHLKSEGNVVFTEGNITSSSIESLRE